MSRVGVVIGISDYARETQLPCCTVDADAVAEFLKATSRFDNIAVIKDATGGQVREQMRAVLPTEATEVFFYFSGHGNVSDTDSFLCASDYDGNRPNETGISRQDLLNMLRSANPELVVMVIDACHSGTALVKSSEDFVQIPKGAFRNVIQIAACMEDQVSFTGRPLSQFTEKFLRALTRKSEGSVYYSDVINTLRDDYRNSVQQVPFFVHQGSFRDLIVEDAKQLNVFSAYMTKLFEVNESGDNTKIALVIEPSLLERLAQADQLLVRPGVIEVFIEGFFDKLLDDLTVGDFAEMYDLDSIAHSSYKESSSQAFITRCLAKETRPDRFVSAELKHKKPSVQSLMNFTTLMMDADERAVQTYELSLNYDLKRAQIRFTLVPKFLVLQQVVLVISCAPSLTYFYAFEVWTEHARTGFESFETSGEEVFRRWHRRKWDGNYDSIIKDIQIKLKEVASAQINSALATIKKE